eukprot:121280-Prymnesium_polylepis.3
MRVVIEGAKRCGHLPYFDLLPLPLLQLELHVHDPSILENAVERWHADIVVGAAAHAPADE